MDSAIDTQFEQMKSWNSPVRPICWAMKKCLDREDGGLAVYVSKMKTGISFDNHG